MRILNVIQCANLGGMEQASLRLMIALKARGHEIEVISLNKIGALGSLLDQAQIPARGLDYSSSGKLRSMLELRRAVADTEADALVLTGHNFAAIAAMLGTGPKSRLFAMHYHHELVMPVWRWRLIYQLAISQFHTITFPSDYVRREAEVIYPGVRSIACTVRNPLFEPPAAPKSAGASFRAKYSIPLGAPLVGNAGWLIERKRFDAFLQTAARIRAVRKDVHFVIAGDGDQRGNLEKLASQLGLSECIVFTGWMDDLTPFYASIDLLLFNSDWDAFPTTPVEAMAQGIPVVASLGHGGLSEVLDNSTGWLIRTHDFDALANFAIHALGPEGAKRAIAAKSRVLSMSNPKQIAETIEKRLLDGHNAKALRN